MQTIASNVYADGTRATVKAKQSKVRDNVYITQSLQRVRLPLSDKFKLVKEGLKYPPAGKQFCQMCGEPGTVMLCRSCKTELLNEGG